MLEPFVCLTISRLAAKLPEMIAEFWGRSLKIQHWSSSDLSGIKNDAHILKIASNQCICPKDWWELLIVGRDRKKTKSLQQWGVHIN